MKKSIFMLATIVGLSFSVNAHLIHITNISNGGPRGYKKIIAYEGLLVSVHSCKNPGTADCPFDGRIMGGSDGTLQGSFVLSQEAYRVAPELPAYAKEFIIAKQTEAFNSSLTQGLFTSTFLVNGELVVLTAGFTKASNNTFKFKVVSNATLEENMLELNALDETD
jgi:hypothetical protein